MGQAEAQLALYRLTAILEAEGLPYAIIGAFALNEYGHRRVTVDVDLVMREEHLQAFKRKHLGKGYEERVPGTGKLLDTAHGVNIDVLSTGRFPGDDKPKPIAFPDPATTALRGERFRAAAHAALHRAEAGLGDGRSAPRQGPGRRAGADQERRSCRRPWRTSFTPGSARSSSSCGTSRRHPTRSERGGL